jgi:hypothetical protein
MLQRPGDYRQAVRRPGMAARLDACLRDLFMAGDFALFGPESAIISADRPFLTL